MLFNSFDFAVFLPVVFILYWFFTNKNLKLQNLLIVAASYLFYGWWDWRFLSLLLVSSLVDFWVGLALSKEENKTKRKLLLGISITANLGMLAFFKYYNFFLENFSAAFSFFGVPIKTSSLTIILPVGISFYTFQTLSYGIDVYRRKLEPTKDIIAFLAFVSFFPQLVAGPIERATNLLPQFFKKRSFNYSKALDGMRQILWGLFKKIVIADNCAEYANAIFNYPDDYSGSTRVLGAMLFTIQIYGDFSGYSDIASGTSRLFGFNLMRNFNFPYFSRDIAEFWRRWHISLSTWFRDYVYNPLGGSRGGMWMKIRNISIVFILSGFWHGANWTYIIWGLLHALYFLPLLIAGVHRNNLTTVAQNTFLPSLKEFFQMLFTFIQVAFALIFFRAGDLKQAINYINGIFSVSLISKPEMPPRSLIILVMLFFLLEWLGRHGEYAFEKTVINWPKPLRFATYSLILFVIFYFTGKQQQFIYFQF